MRHLGKAKRLLFILIILDAALILYLSVHPPRKKITVAGSSTVFPLVQRWADIYMNLNPQVSIEVTGGGSGMGIVAAGEHTVDIGMSSHPLEQSQKEKFPNLIEIPIALDGVAIIANEMVNKTLKLTREMVVAIFSGAIATWDEFEEEFGVSIDATGEIIVCVRADKSGTTEVFSKWLSLDPDWKIGSGEVVSWPKSSRFISGNGNQEILMNVKSNLNAIGYVGLAYTSSADIVVAEILNPSTGEYVKPTQESVKKSAEKGIFQPNESLFDPPISGAYPISRSLYLIIDRVYIKDKEHVIEFIRWILDSDGGQVPDIVRDVGYVEISDTKLQEIAIEIIDNI